MTFVNWEKQSKRRPVLRGHLSTPLAAIPLQLCPQTIIPTTCFLRLHIMSCLVWVRSQLSSLWTEGTLNPSALPASRLVQTAWLEGAPRKPSGGLCLPHQIHSGKWCWHCCQSPSGTSFSFQNGHHSSERVRELTCHLFTAVSDPFHFAS